MIMPGWLQAARIDFAATRSGWAIGRCRASSHLDRRQIPASAPCRRLIVPGLAGSNELASWYA
jgi:hypothetical protein